MERVIVEEQAPPRLLRARWLGRVAYREAWAWQRMLADARAAGALREDQLLLLEHDPVLTLGRNALQAHVVAPPELLAARGIEVVRVERGGEVTYHGPGQLVAYPIVALLSLDASGVPAAGVGGRRPLGVRAYVEALEAAMADTCAAAGIVAGQREGHPGCWVEAGGILPRKVGALGIRVARGVTYHGIALNVTTNLADFELIDPCGMPGLRTTSLARERARAGIPGADADGPPDTASVAAAAAVFATALARRLGFVLAGDLPPRAGAAGERRAIDRLVDELGMPPPAIAAPAPTLAQAGAS
jgi:lipoyl(octanoyl) transferase